MDGSRAGSEKDGTRADGRRDWTVPECSHLELVPREAGQDWRVARFGMMGKRCQGSSASLAKESVRS